MTSVKIKRLVEWSNRKFAYNIEVNGQESFKIKSGEERIVSIDSASTIQAKLMWGGSEKISLLPDEETVKEIRISANKGIHLRFPLVALITIVLCGILYITYPKNGVKEFTTCLLAGFVFYSLALLTIWRNKFIDIEVVR